MRAYLFILTRQCIVWWGFFKIQIITLQDIRIFLYTCIIFTHNSDSTTVKTYKIIKTYRLLLRRTRAIVIG